MDKIIKFLNRRTKTERIKLLLILKLIIENKLENLDIKKIEGEKNIFRVRIGQFRIIFEKEKSENIILDIRNRDNQTYKN